MSEQITPVDENCGNCRFLRQGPSYFRCCRYPPVANPMHAAESATGFPIVRPDDWCGEFKPG
jgi:hypothetical protein